MTAIDLPRWDLVPFFPAVGSREFAAAHEALAADVVRLTALFERHDVRGDRARSVDDETITAFEEVLAATNALLERLRLVSAYVTIVVAADARDDVANGTLSQVKMATSQIGPLLSRFDAWIAALDAESVIAASPAAADHAHRVRKAERSARHQMTEVEEALAAELNLTGASAWATLWGQVTARLTAAVSMADCAVETLPITAVRNLASHADASVRRAAYDAELAAWRTVEVVCAACMNGVKGEAVALNRHRRWADPLDPSLHANNVDRATLDAMTGAVVDALPSFRRYLQAKATLLGAAGADDGLAWWDMLAPVGATSGGGVAWDQACDLVRSAFGSYSPALAGLAERAMGEAWLDAAPREGKRGGAFCMPMRSDESRILLNFDGSFDGVSTLAHELGHAYHNTTLAERTPLQRSTPMALAETASIFCETVLVQSLIAAAADAGDADRRLALLNTDLTGATQVVVDIHSRFLFEQAVFERRAGSTLSPDDLCRLMTDAQLAAYGDGLDPDSLHPYMWAVKPHYYQTAFYNWPYTFGLLFGIGLYARYLDDPDRFRMGYDDLLSSTGMGDASELAGRFGIDVRDEAFWSSSLDVLRTRIDEFCALAGPPAQPPS